MGFDNKTCHGKAIIKCHKITCPFDNQFVTKAVVAFSPFLNTFEFGKSFKRVPKFYFEAPAKPVVQVWILGPFKDLKASAHQQFWANAL